MSQKKSKENKQWHERGLQIKGKEAKSKLCGLRGIFLFNKLKQKFKSLSAIAEFYFHRHSGIFFFIIISSSIYAVVIEWHNHASGTQSTFFFDVYALNWMWTEGVHERWTCYTNLLYISMSGFHNLFGVIRKSLTPPYSDSFHFKL